MKSLWTTRTITLLAAILLGADLAPAQPPANVDALPPRAFQRLGASKLRHGSRILCLAYSPAGDILAAGGGNDPVRLWDPKTGDLIREINEPWVHALSFTDSGETLVYAGDQKSVRLWSIKLNKDVGRLEGHKAAVRALAVSPDTSTIASGSQDGMIYLWEWTTKQKVIELKGHADEVTALAFSPQNSNLLASAASDRLIALWDIETNKTKVRIDAGCAVHAIAFSADGNTLYSAGDDHLIRRWDVATGKHTGTFKGHADTVVSLQVRGDRLISGALDRTMRIWDAQTTNQLKVLPRGAGDSDALAASKAGDFVATAGLNNTIRIFATATGQETLAGAGPQSGLTVLALSRDNQRLAALTADAQIVVWDAAAGKLVRQWDARHVGETLLALTPDGKTLLTADTVVRLWNTDTGALLNERGAKAFDPVRAAAFSTDGKTLALGHRSGQVELWDWQANKSLGAVSYDGHLHAVAFAPDGKTLAAGGGAKVLLWNLPSRSLIKSFDVKESPAAGFPLVAALAFAPDGKTLAAGCFDAVIRIYNTSAKNPTDLSGHRTCEGHLSVAYALAFSADGRTLVSGSFDKTTRLWEAFSGKQIALYKGHVGAVMGVAFRADGRSVYSAATDTTALQWDVPGLANNGKLPLLTLTPQELENAWLTLATEDTPRGHDSMWRSVASAKQAVPHMAGKLYLLDPELVVKLFRDLDSSNFVVRSQAMDKLSSYGRWMEGRYDEAMAKSPSLEYKRRVEILKEKLTEKKALSLLQERLRVRRFMLMCEQVANAAALDALKQIAERGPEEELREEAKASLARLRK